ncbi:GNAT family N-acetyltransferase [Streptomyces buecherae]|uniref:GNAT family N-acetyltransferase n=1 Tax=Streptomyces buecherae TaxID=2763006 RepID=A0A7H8NEQ5_9ACTN|nr:GNAT family N-acetyltransferase [Streptomyces buecherae]QKW52945.1 GNAT family N-acetyltransferase [Streptomyces buecherae]
MTTTVTTWYLEQTAPGDLSPAPAPAPGAGVRIVRAEVPSPEFSRFLYASVGGDIAWTDRLAWTYAQWQGALARPGVETWVAYERGTPAGYVELAANPDGSSGSVSSSGSAGSVEIVYFGLLPAFRGRRIGGHLLSVGVQRAWDLGERWPDLPATRRVWLHTCSKDGEHALGNYQKRGFSVYRTTTDEEPEPVSPGPWPGAYPAPTSA